MVGAEMLSAEFPERRIKVADVDHITGRLVDFDSITNTVRNLHQNVDPTYETRNRSLKCKPENERYQTERHDGRVPVGEQDRDRDKEYRQSREERRNPV